VILTLIAIALGFGAAYIVGAKGSTPASAISEEVEQEQTGKSPYEILIRSQGWTWMSIRRQCSAKAVPVQVYDLSTVMTTGVRVLRLEIN